MLQKILQNAMVVYYENKLVLVQNNIFFSIFSNKILKFYKLDIFIHIYPKICLNTNFKSFDQVYSGYRSYSDFIG